MIELPEKHANEKCKTFKMFVVWYQTQLWSTIWILCNHSVFQYYFAYKECMYIQRFLVHYSICSVWWLLMDIWKASLLKVCDFDCTGCWKWCWYYRVSDGHKGIHNILDVYQQQVVKLVQTAEMVLVSFVCSKLARLFLLISCQVGGITLPIMKQALLQAKDGRKHILGNDKLHVVSHS